MKLVAYMIQPKNIARQTEFIPYGPTRKSAMKFVDPKIVPILPTNPAHMKSALSRGEEWWADHFDEVLQRWEVYLAK